MFQRSLKEKCKSSQNILFVLDIAGKGLKVGTPVQTSSCLWPPVDDFPLLPVPGIKQEVREMFLSMLGETTS